MGTDSPPPPRSTGRQYQINRRTDPAPDKADSHGEDGTDEPTDEKFVPYVMTREELLAASAPPRRKKARSPKIPFVLGALCLLAAAGLYFVSTQAALVETYEDETRGDLFTVDPPVDSDGKVYSSHAEMYAARLPPLSRALATSGRAIEEVFALVDAAPLSDLDDPATPLSIGHSPIGGRWPDRCRQATHSVYVPWFVGRMNKACGFLSANARPAEIDLVWRIAGDHFTRQCALHEVSKDTSLSEADRDAALAYAEVDRFDSLMPSNLADADAQFAGLARAALGRVRDAVTATATTRNCNKVDRIQGPPLPGT